VGGRALVSDHRLLGGPSEVGRQSTLGRALRPETAEIGHRAVHGQDINPPLIDSADSTVTVQLQGSDGTRERLCSIYSFFPLVAKSSGRSPPRVLLSRHQRSLPTWQAAAIAIAAGTHHRL